MSAEPFALRVRSLHESWRERREVKALASAHDRTSQFRLLLSLHGWAVEALSDVQAVYGPDFPLVIDAPPKELDSLPGFTVQLGGQALTLSLLQRSRANTRHWYISVAFSSSDPAGTGHIATDRRNGQWNRGRMQELLLTLLGGYERSIGAAGEQAGLSPRPEARNEA